MTPWCRAAVALARRTISQRPPRARRTAGVRGGAASRFYQPICRVPTGEGRCQVARQSRLCHQRPENFLEADAVPDSAIRSTTVCCSTTRLASAGCRVKARHARRCPPGFTARGAEAAERIRQLTSPVSHPDEVEDFPSPPTARRGTSPPARDAFGLASRRAEVVERAVSSTERRSRRGSLLRRGGSTALSSVGIAAQAPASRRC